MSLPLVLRKHDGFYSIPLLERFGAKAVFTAKKYNMGFPDSGRNASCLSRKEAYREIGMHWPYLVCPSQVHGERIGVVDHRHRGRGLYHRLTAIPGTDALMTKERCLPIGILTADCLPVFVLDYRQRVVTLVHAGWKGVYQKIISKAIRKMSRIFKTAPSDLLVVLGPAIRLCCYEVGGEFLNYFPEDAHAKGSKLYFDLAGAAIRQIKEEGVSLKRIYDSHICTSCMNNEFFSFRKEGDRAGRSMSVVELL